MHSWMMLGPNDRSCTPITPATLFPLGSLSVALTTEPACYPSLAAALLNLPAWVPLITVAPFHLADPLATWLTFLDEARTAQSIVYPHPLLELPEATTLRGLVNRRPAIQPHIMARWLARRIQQPAEVIEALLAATLATETGASASRGLRQRVRAHLHCRPSDLVRLHHLATLPRLAENTGRLAASAGTTTTRLAQRVRRALGLSLANYNARPGWEWPLEAACRHGLGQPDREWGVGSGEWGVGSGPGR